MVSTADNGRIDTPRPEATMWRMVSSELDSTVVWLAASPLRTVGQASSTWSRKSALAEQQQALCR